MGLNVLELYRSRDKSSKLGYDLFALLTLWMETLFLVPLWIVQMQYPVPFSFIINLEILSVSVFTVLGGSVVLCCLCVMMFSHRTGLRTKPGSVQAFMPDRPTTRQLVIEEAN